MVATIDRLSISIRYSCTPLCNLSLAGVTTSVRGGSHLSLLGHSLPHLPSVTLQSIVHRCWSYITRVQLKRADYLLLYPLLSHSRYIKLITTSNLHSAAFSFSSSHSSCNRRVFALCFFFFGPAIRNTKLITEQRPFSSAFFLSSSPSNLSFSF